MDRAMKQMLEAMAVRQQLQQQTTQRNAPVTPTRTPDRSVPNLSPRGTALLQAIIGNKGVSKVGKSATGPIASRADLLEQAMGNGQQQTTTTPPTDSRTFTPEQSLDLFMQSPAGQYAGGRYNDPSQRESVMQQFILDGLARQQGAEEQAQAAATATERGGPRSTFGSNPILPNPTLVSGVQQPGTESYKQDQIAQLDAYIAEGRYILPPPGSDIPKEEWDQYSTEDRKAIALGMRQQYESMPATVPENLEAIQLEAGADNEFDQPDSTNPGGWAAGQVKDVLAEPVSWAVEQVSRPIRAREMTEADIMYYMATHNGEMPPGLTGDIYGGINSVVDAVNSIPSPNIREQDSGPPSLEDVKQMQSTGTGRLSSTNKTDTMIGPTWLADNPWAYPIVQKIYEEAEKNGATPPTSADITGHGKASTETEPGDGAAAVNEWFKSNQTLLGRAGEEILLDPLNLVFVTGIIKKGFLTAADKAYLADKPYIARLLRSSGVIIGTPDTVLNKGPEKLFEGLGWAGRKAGLLAPSETAIRETALEGVTDAQRAIQRTPEDAEAEYMARKTAAADEKLVEDQAAADAQAAAEKKIRDDAVAKERSDAARGRETLRRQEEARKQAEARAAAKAENDAERAAQAELDAQIKAANQRVEAAKVEAQKKATYRNMWEERRNKAIEKQQTLEEKAAASAAVKKAKAEERAAAQAEKEAQAELDRLIAQSTARQMPETMPLEAAPVSVPANPKITPGVMGEPVDDQLKLPTAADVDTSVDNVAPTVDDTVPARTDEPWDLGYLDPDYVSKFPDEPNLAKVARDTFGPSNPEALARFKEQYSNLARRWMKHDATLRDAEAAKGAKGASRETAQRTVDRLNFNAEADSLFELNFGAPSPVKRYMVFGDALDENNPLSLLEHAVYGKNVGEARYAADLIRSEPRQIHPSFSNEKLADWAEDKYNLVNGETPRAKPASASPDPWDTPTETAPLSDNQAMRTGWDYGPIERLDSNPAGRFIRRSDGKIVAIPSALEDGDALSWARRQKESAWYSDEGIDTLSTGRLVPDKGPGTTGNRVIAKGDPHFPAPNRDKSTYQAIPYEDDQKYADSLLQDIDEEISAGGKFTPGDRQFKRTETIEDPTDDLDYLMEHAVFGSEDDFGIGKRGKAIKSNKISGSASRAREILRNKHGLSVAADRAKQLRKQAFGAQIDEFPEDAAKTSRNPSVNGIVNDPMSDAAAMAEATKAGFQRGVDAIPESMAAPSAKIVVSDEAVLRVENVQYADRLQARFKDGRFTQADVDTVTQRHTLNVGTKEKPVEIQTSVWERYNEVFDTLQGKRKPIDFKKNTTMGEDAAALKQWIADWDVDAATAWEQVRKEFTEAIDPKQKGKRNLIQKSDRMLTSTMGVARQNAMYNVATGPGAALQDFLGNLRTTTIGGEIGSARRVLPIVKQLIAAGADPESWMEIPALANLRKMGIPLPSDLFRTVGREQIERTDDLWTTRLGNALHIPNRLNALHLISSETMKMIRQFQDSAWRISTFANHINRNLGAERVKFLRSVEKKMGTREGAWTDIKNLGPYMSVEDVATVMRKYGTDQSLQRTWAKQLGEMSRAANKKQNSLYFSYKKLKIDDPLSRGFMFHYFMSRHSIQYAKFMMQHPQLIRMEHELWSWTEENKPDIPEPEWMKGFVGWAYGNGHVVYTDPVAVLSGLTVSSQVGKSEFDRSGLDAVIQKTGLFPNPILRGAFAALGLMSPGDPLMTTGIRRMLIAVSNEIINSEWGKKHVPEGWTFTPDFYQDMLNWIIETANDRVKGLPGAKEINLTDSVEGQENKALKILMDNMIDEYGLPTKEDPWTQEEWDTYVAARDAIISGADNEYAEAAIEESISLDTRERLGNVASPTTVITRDAGTVENDATLGEAFDSLEDGTPLTPEQQGVMDLSDLNKTPAGAMTDLSTGSQRYYDMVEGLDQSLKDGVKFLTEGVIPDGMRGTIGGKVYTSDMVNAMSTDERFDLADQWLMDQGAVSSRDSLGVTMAGGARDENGQITAGRLAATKNAQQELRAGNPTLDDYLSFQSYTYKLGDTPGALRGWRQELLNMPGDTEFKLAHERERQSLVDDGLAGEELELELDSWMHGQKAYAALMGMQWRTNLDTGEPTYTAVIAKPWRELTPAGSSSGGSSSSSKDKSGKPEQVGLSFLADRGKRVGGRGYDIRDTIYAMPGDKKSGSTGSSGGIFDEWLRAP